MHVKGTVVKSINEYVKNNYKDEYKLWLKSLSPSSQEIFSNPINVSQLYDVDASLIEPSGKVAAMFFNNREEASRELGRYSAETALKGVYKVFVLIATPAYVISKAGNIMKTLYTGCTMEVVEKASKSVSAEVKNLPKNDLILEQRIAGWIEKALEITGCVNINIYMPKRSSRGHGVTRYDVTWE